MSLKNHLYKIALKALPIPKHPISLHRRILTISTTALGDTLWATPALKSLRKSFPDAYIGALTSPIGTQVLKNNPDIDRIYPLSHPLSLWRTLYKDRFDTILIFHASQRFILPLAASLGAHQIIGTAGINKGLDALLTYPLPNHSQHEITRRLKMVEAIGGTIYTETLIYHPAPIPPPLPPGRYIALHPGSKDPFKRWPATHFIALGKALSRHGTILITGTPSERALTTHIASQIPDAQAIDTHESLDHLAALLNQTQLFISNDTGPVHLACALKRPVLALYSSTDPNLCGPHHAPHATALYKRRTCDPCIKKKCRRPFCLLQISIPEVLQAAEQKLSR